MWPQNVTIRPQELRYDQLSSPKRQDPEPSLWSADPIDTPTCKKPARAHIGWLFSLKKHTWVLPLNRLSMSYPKRDHARQVKRNRKDIQEVILEGEARPC